MSVGLRRAALGVSVTLVAGVLAMTVVAARRLPTIRPNTYIGAVSLGGLTKEEATKQIRVWWETAKLQKLKIHAAGAVKEIPARTPGALGVTIDDAATAATLPTTDLITDVQNIVHEDGSKTEVKPVYKGNGTDLTAFGKEVIQAEPVLGQAKVLYEKGAIYRTHEQPGVGVDWPNLLPAVTAALTDDKPVEVPLKTGVKKITDEQVDSIKDVVSQFTTHFPASNHPRCSNIKLASSKLRGVLLMPGDRLSFNGTVGRRTLKAGFQVAGVYKNGKHDTGIGGGICQVSTTLYNASLFANLKIRQRSNHSLPVAYVPLGRDATVDYGDLDLVVENTYTTPIAIDAHYAPGQLTFLVLGTKDPSLTVKIEQTNAESWDQETETIIDHSLRPGSRHIVEPGSRGHSVTTYRLIYHDGKLTKKEYLSHSTYGGQNTVVAINPAPRIVTPRPVAPGIQAPIGPAAPAGAPPAVGG